MINTLDVGVPNFYDILEARNFKKVIEAISKKPELFLFRCIDAAITMIEEEICENNHFFCLGLLADLINRYGVPAITPLNTEDGVLVLRKALQISRYKAEEIAILSLEKCSFDETRECISFISDFYKESFPKEFEMDNFPDSEEDQENKFVPFYLRLEKLSSNVQQYSTQEELKEKLKKLETDYSQIENLKEMEKDFVKFEFDLIYDHLKSLETPQSQPREDQSKFNDNIEEINLNNHIDSSEPIPKISEEDPFDLNGGVEDDNLNNQLDGYTEKSSMLQAEPLTQHEPEKKAISRPPVLEDKNNFEESKNESVPPALQSESSPLHASNKKEIPALSSKQNSQDIKVKLKNPSASKVNYSFQNHSAKKVDPIGSSLGIQNDLLEFQVSSENPFARAESSKFDPDIQPSCGLRQREKMLTESPCTSTH